MREKSGHVVLLPGGPLAEEPPLGKSTDMTIINGCGERMGIRNLVRLCPKTVAENNDQLDSIWQQVGNKEKSGRKLTAGPKEGGTRRKTTPNTTVKTSHHCVIGSTQWARSRRGAEKGWQSWWRGDAELKEPHSGTAYVESWKTLLSWPPF